MAIRLSVVSRLKDSPGGCQEGQMTVNLGSSSDERLIKDGTSVASAVNEVEALRGSMSLNSLSVKLSKRASQTA